MTYIIDYFFSYRSSLSRLAAADGLFLFAVKKKQKTSAENFSFKASRLAGVVESEKFVRPISVERGYGAMA